MQKYLNLYNNSSIVGYDIKEESISVCFNDNKVYTYSYAKAGKENVEIMKSLAKQGYGLNSYIMNNVRFMYD